MMPAVFSSAWFDRHQRALLGLLNAPVIGGEFRHALAIRKCDRRIVRVLPHAYVVVNPDGSFTMDVRTHAKYAKRLHYQFMPIWKAAHAWDRFVANPLVPALNVGFDTLTEFPDPDPEVTTVDGVTARNPSPESWASLIAGSGLAAVDNAPTDNLVFIRSGATSNLWDFLYRDIVLFDTSALTNGAVISTGVVSFFGQAKDDSLGIAPTYDIYTSTPASNTAVIASDYSQVGAVSQTGAPITFAGFSISSYNDSALNAIGRGNISKTSITKFGIRNANYDVAAVSPTWVASLPSSITAFFADQTGSANDPKLVVNFTIPEDLSFVELAASQQTAQRSRTYRTI